MQLAVRSLMHHVRVARAARRGDADVASTDGGAYTNEHQLRRNERASK